MAREAGVGAEDVAEDSRRGTVSRFGILSRKGMGRMAHGVCRDLSVCMAEGRSQSGPGETNEAH